MALLRDQMKQELARKQAQQQGAPPGYRQIEGGRPPQAGEAPPETGSATPDEQAVFEKVVLGGMQILYDEKTHKDVMEMLGSADPATSLGELVALIITQVDEKNGGRVPEDMILPAAMEIMDAAAELASVAGLFEVDPDVAETATHIMVARLANIYGVDPEEAQRMLQENVPEEQLFPAGEEASQNPMRWKPYRETPDTEAREGETQRQDAMPGEEQEEMR